ncbi:MAG TPA: ankyrin repeat domain-containing protein [Steroidobacteraceae bacterium]|nr:ankyrin repeat domain-containing protein [Steroidobacteraceae bacterium]
MSGLSVRQRADGAWTADFDYYYTGAPHFAALRIDLLPQADASNSPEYSERWRTFLPSPQPGSHHVSVAIAYPQGQGTSRQVVVRLLRELLGDEVLASQGIDKIIDWPDFQTWVRDQQVAQNSPENNLKHAIALIDSEDEPQLREAKAIIEKLISQNPRLDAGYVELARIAMKTNWGPEGLHQAETLLSSALQIRPDSANAKILLGYVYAHQHRFDQAEKLFADAARSNPPNLWLWTNWGESLEMQGRIDQAISRYREAIARPMTHDTYDRARENSYLNLLALLEKRKDFDGMEALYKQRLAEFGPGSCYSSDYARFKLQVRGDTQGAIDLARGALNQNCEDSPARQVLGLAEYVKWADSTGPQRSDALNEARIYLPAGPMPLYLLAASERTTIAVKQLIAAGEGVDQTDNEGMTALAYALQNGDSAAAKRLLALGARPDIAVGPLKMPTALIPVMEGNVETVRALRQAGVDYTKLHYRGATAADLAKVSGNKEMLDVLTESGAQL